MKGLVKNTVAAACLAFTTMGAYADLAPDFMDKLLSDSRPEADRVRDGSRRPYQVMNLLGVDEGMTVMDIGAGGGWYTRVMSAAVGPRGKVISQFGPRALQRNNGQAQRDLAGSLGNTEAFFGEVAEYPANSIDRAITALNIHHFNNERAEPYFKAIYNVLKPGGQVAIIDHIGLEGMENGMMHRMLKADAKRWIEDAGLQIVVDSDLLRTNADDHQLSISDPIYGRDVDRFVFIARKPE